MEKRFLKDGDSAGVKKIDASVQNKWSWKWQHEVLTRQLLVGTVSYKLGDCIFKIDKPGHAWCKWCQDFVKYGTAGKKHLVRHCGTEKHVKHLRTISGNYMLGSVKAPSSTLSTSAEPKEKVFSMFKSSISKPTSEQVSKSVGSGGLAGPSTEALQPTISIPERTANTEAMILAFLAEHSLPLSLADSLTSLIQEAARDPKALNGLSLSKSAASYKMNHGLGKTLKGRIISKLKDCAFSLNIDEATNDHGKKVLSLMVSFFDEEAGAVSIHHLSSVELIKVDAKSVFQAIVEVIDINQLPWNNLLSVLLDSCNTMRGVKSGVEVLIREKCPHLLDIDGESCHHAHGVSKAICQPFGFWLERLYMDLHLDFKYCTEYKDAMCEICMLAGVNFTVPSRFINQRWLNAHDQSIETSRLFDLYLVFYSAFLPVHLRAKYTLLLDNLMQKFSTHGARQRVRQILSVMRGKTMTSDGKERKQRILTRLFEEQNKTLLQLDFYQASMFSLKCFVELLQKKEPLIHRLHELHLKTTRRFLCNFIEAKHIVGKSAADLKRLDISESLMPQKMSKKGTYTPDVSKIFIGKDAKHLLAISESNVKTEFLKSVKIGYMSAGKKMLQKFPLTNETLVSLASINPDNRTKTAAKEELYFLCASVSHLLSEEEQQLADQEVMDFISHTELPKLDKGRIDLWWSEISLFPTLKKVVKIVLSLFHGPIVEGSFSSMKDIMKKKSGRMSVSTFDSIQTVKYYLQNNSSTAVKAFRRPSVNHTPVTNDLYKNMTSAWLECKKDQKAKNEKASQKLASVSLTKKHLQTAAAARRIKKNSLLVTLKKHQKTIIKSVKRKASTTPSGPPLKKKKSSSSGSTGTQRKA